MNPLELIQSDDIETVQLAVNILIKDSNIIEIEDILSKTNFRVRTFDREYIVLRKKPIGLYEQMKNGNNVKIPKFDEKTLKEKINKIFNELQ
jgi:hypothetical protein